MILKMAMKLLQQPHKNTCLLLIIIVILLIVAVMTRSKHNMHQDTERFESINTTALPIGNNTLVISGINGKKGNEQLTVATDLGDLDTITLSTTPQNKTYYIQGDVSSIFLKFMNGQSSNLSVESLMYNGTNLIPSDPDKIVYLQNNKLNVGEYVYKFVTTDNKDTPMIVIYNDEETSS